MLSHRKKPTRNSMATMGTLSGFFTMSAKFGSSMDTPRKATARMPMIAAGRERQIPRVRRASRNRMAATVMKISGAVSALMTSLRVEIILASSLRSAAENASQRPRDPAVLADAPEMDGHEDAR